MISLSLALLISIIGLLILIKVKLHPGFAIFAGSLIISFLVFAPSTIPVMMQQTLIDYQTIRLMVIIASALTLSYLMEGKGLLAELASAMESINPKLALHFIPAVIGFVPMPAGALISATASQGLGKRMGLTAEQGTFINYWFRHIWEPCLPVYPAIIITSVVLAVPLSSIVTALLPLTALSITFGAIASYRILKNVRVVKSESNRNIAHSFVRGAWPILFLIPSVLLGLEAMIAFPLTLALLAIQQRVKWSEMKKALKYGLDPKILLLLYSVMLYKATIESSGAAEAVLMDMQTAGLPALVILVVLPFIMGFATGYGPAYAGVAFPLLVPYIALDTGINSSALLLAYASGLTGLLVSPVHLCLLLSVQYFKANFATVYKYVLPPVLAVEISIVLIYLLTS
ncbi:DUF401 family protein [Chloroflexota bacterium]